MLPPPRSQRSFSDSETQSDNITPSMAPYYFQENCQTPYCDSQETSWSGSSLISSLRLYPSLWPLPEVLNDYHSSVIQAFTCAVGFSSQPFWSTPNHPLSSREDQKNKKKVRETGRKVECCRSWGRRECQGNYGQCCQSAERTQMQKKKRHLLALTIRREQC